MATALSVLAEKWEEVDGSKFLLSPLDGKDMLRVSDAATFNDKGQTLFNAEVCIVALRHGLKGWDDFKDADGKDVLFISDREKNLSRIPLDLVRTLAMIILGNSQLGAEDAKN